MSLKKKEKSKTEKNLYTLEFSVEKETFDAAVNKVYAKEVKKINVPGFRKGKAPRAFIEKMYGEGVFYDDALELAFPDAYTAAVAEAGRKLPGCRLYRRGCSTTQRGDHGAYRGAQCRRCKLRCDGCTSA